MTLDVHLKTTREHIDIHPPHIDLLLMPIGRDCRCASKPCGCSGSKGVYHRGAVVERDAAVGDPRETVFSCVFDLDFGRTYLDNQEDGEDGVNRVAFAASLEAVWNPNRFKIPST